MNSPFNALKTAVIEAAKADPAISAICGARVYEEVPRDARGDPSDAQAPFVYLDHFAWRDIEAGCGPLYAVTLRLNAVATEFGRKQSRDLAEAIAVAFNRKTLPLAGGHAMTIFKAVAGGDVPAVSTVKECFVELRTELADANGYPLP